MAIYSDFSHEKIVIFHSYVSLPEGTLSKQTQKKIWRWRLEMMGIIHKGNRQSLNVPGDRSSFPIWCYTVFFWNLKGNFAAKIGIYFPLPDLICGYINLWYMGWG